MSEELAIQLHRLYRDYYARRLEFEDYRYRRALLLDSLSGKIEDFKSEDGTLPRQAEFDEAETVVVEPSDASPIKRPVPTFRWYYVLAACVVVVVGVVFVVTRQLDSPVETPVADIPPAPTGLPVEPLRADDPPPEQQELIVPPDVGQELVEAFVSRQDWRELSLLEFQDSWSRIPESDRIVAKGAVWFEALSESLAYKIEEAAEFSSDPEYDEQLNALYEFSVALGLVELVPAGWMPAAEDINRGAESLAPEEPASELVAADSSPDIVADALPETDVPVDPPAEDVIESAEAEPTVEIASPVAVENENACSAAQLETRRRNCFDLLSGGENGPLMRVLPAGEFPFGDAGTLTTVGEPFAISAFEIKASEFRLYCQATGVPCPTEPWSDDDMPAVDVSWHRAVGYAEWLSSETGYTYRLPTDEEWEYAARAGTTTTYPYGERLLPAQARYSSIADYDSPLPTSDRTTQRNEFGLWHMVGNVREWVAGDGTAPDTKIVRGGSYASNDDELRSTAKQEMSANEKDELTGFRLLREL